MSRTVQAPGPRSRNTAAMRPAAGRQPSASSLPGLILTACAPPWAPVPSLQDKGGLPGQHPTEPAGGSIQSSRTHRPEDAARLLGATGGVWEAWGEHRLPRAESVQSLPLQRPLLSHLPTHQVALTWPQTFGGIQGNGSRVKLR